MFARLNTTKTLLTRSLVVLGLTASLSLSACGSAAQSGVRLGQESTLSIGQELTIKNEPLKIKFVDILTDSRCPTGATCVWQGEVTARLDLSFQGTTTSANATQPGLTEEPSSVKFQGYSLKFRIQPYPEVTKQIGKQEYRLLLSVSKD